MAQLDGILPLRGKLGNLVFTNGSKLGARVRTRPKKSGKKKAPEFRYQSHRAAYLNGLASEINRIIKNYHPDLKGRNLYADMLSQFRKEPLDNRFLLLRQLKQMDINPGYKYSRMGRCTTEINISGNKLHISLHTTMHPGLKTEEAVDVYSYSLLLISWTQNGPSATHQQQLSDWIEKDGPQKEFDFEFELPPDTAHWLLCLHQGMGVYDMELELISVQGMEFHDMGTLVNKDLEILKQRNLPVEKKPYNKIENKIRVKARES